jgi:ABC-2 type transport system permease protein
MTLTQVAQKDFEDAVRSKMVWSIIGVFVGFMGFVMLVAVSTTDGATAPGDAALGLTAQLSQLFVPLIALIVGYMAIVGERQSGSLRVLLTYPHSRRDIVFGKLLGRSGVITIAVGVGSTLSLLVATLLVAPPDVANTAGLVGSIILFGVAFTGVAIGISASVRSRGQAMALAIGSLLVFLLVWDAAAAGVYAAITGALPGLEAKAWYFLLKRASPVGAFRAIAGGFVSGQLGPLFQVGLEQIPQDATSAQRQLSNRVSGPLPLYLTNWFAGVTLIAWAVVPTVFGYLQFSRSDI